MPSYMIYFFFSSSGMCPLPSVSAEYASDSYIVFTIEIVSHWNTEHFKNCLKMCLLMVLKYSQGHLLFEEGGKLIRYVSAFLKPSLFFVIATSEGSSVHCPSPWHFSNYTIEIVATIYDLDYFFFQNISYSLFWWPFPL